MKPKRRSTRRKAEGRVMAQHTASNLAWIRPIHLFTGLNDRALADILARCQEQVYQAGEVIVRQDDPAEGLYFIREGAVTLHTTHPRRGEVLLAALGTRDYFDVEGALYRGRHVVTVRALRRTRVYRLPLEDLEALRKEHTSFRAILDLVALSQRRARLHLPPWLERGEAIYLYLTKHWAALLPSLMFPALLLGLALLLFATGLIVGLVFPIAMGALPFVWAVGLALWRWVDWRNDFYLVTSRRVVWVEKVVLLYESRREAPLRTILSVSTFKDFVGQTLGYGDVLIRTFTGQVTFRHVHQPDLVQVVLQDFWQREKTQQRIQERKEMIKLLRQRLGLEPPTPQEEPPVALPNEPSRRSAMARLIRSWFADRIEDGSVVTYRKHWFLLLRRTWWILLTFTLLFVGDIAYFVDFLKAAQHAISPRTVLVVSLMLYATLIGFGIYHLWDWQNDIYMLTADQVVDIERKPLGDEKKQAAPLESIQTLDYTREGLLGLLFNFGDVNIRAGTTTLVFRGVHAPDQVQKEIFARLEERLRIKQAAQARQERERVVEWLSVYHEAVQVEEEEEEDWWADEEEA